MPDDSRDLPLPLDENDKKMLLHAAWARENRPEVEIKAAANQAAYLWQYANSDGVEIQDVRDFLSLLVEAYTNYPVWAFPGLDSEDEILNRGREILVIRVMQMIEPELSKKRNHTSEEREMRIRAIAERIVDLLNDRD